MEKIHQWLELALTVDDLLQHKMVTSIVLVNLCAATKLFLKDE